MSASGFTKNMDQLLLHEMGMIDDVEEESGDESDFYENEEDEVERLAERVDELMNLKKPSAIIENSANQQSEENEEVDRLAELMNLKKPSTIVENSANQQSEEAANFIKSDSEEYISLSENEDCESVVSSKVCYSDIHSVCSMSTATTIPPEVIRDRVKKSLERRERATVRHRKLAKGEASAVNRQRRENKSTIKDSFGIWG